MTWVVSVVGLKGGCGKSTVAITLATTLHKAGHRVTLVDCDPQGTARAWAARAAELEQEGPMVVGLDSKQLKRDLASLTASSDVAVIDTAPRLDAGARLAMSEADLVLLPTTPGAADVWALQQTLELFEQVGTPGGVVLNRTDRTALSRAALKALEGYDVEVIGRLGSRVAFGEAILAGLGVVQNAPSSIAADEARKLTKAVIGALHAKKD